MKIRTLEIRDIPLILEWMKDPEINQFFRFDSCLVDEHSVEKFILGNENINLAITDDNEEYLGTVSLKEIDYNHKTAEFAIALRKKAIGKGIGKEASIYILNMAFRFLKFEEIYLNVLSNNERAIKLYEKLGFEFDFEEDLTIRNVNYKLSWYSLKKEKYEALQI